MQVRSLKLAIMPHTDRESYGRGNKRRVYMLLVIALAQPFFMWWLTRHIVPSSWSVWCSVCFGCAVIVEICHQCWFFTSREPTVETRKENHSCKTKCRLTQLRRAWVRFDFISWISIHSDGTLGLWFRWNVEAVICRHITQMSTDVKKKLIKSFQQMKIKFRILQAWYRWYQILIYSCPAGSNNICIWSLKRD